MHTMEKGMRVVRTLDRNQEVHAIAVSADQLVSFLALRRVGMSVELSREFAACGDV